MKGIFVPDEFEEDVRCASNGILPCNSVGFLTFDHKGKYTNFLTWCIAYYFMYNEVIGW